MKRLEAATHWIECSEGEEWDFFMLHLFGEKVIDVRASWYGIEGYQPITIVRAARVVGINITTEQVYQAITLARLVAA